MDCEKCNKAAVCMYNGEPARVEKELAKYNDADKPVYITVNCKFFEGVRTKRGSLINK